MRYCKALTKNAIVDSIMFVASFCFAQKKKDRIGLCIDFHLYIYNVYLV
jgi:hypothetical protein